MIPVKGGENKNQIYQRRTRKHRMQAAAEETAEEQQQEHEEEQEQEHQEGGEEGQEEVEDNSGIENDRTTTLQDVDLDTFFSFSHS